jgi:hypothetical protein
MWVAVRSVSHPFQICLLLSLKLPLLLLLLPLILLLFSKNLMLSLLPVLLLLLLMVAVLLVPQPLRNDDKVNMHTLQLGRAFGAKEATGSARAAPSTSATARCCAASSYLLLLSGVLLWLGIASYVKSTWLHFGS